MAERTKNKSQSDSTGISSVMFVLDMLSIQLADIAQDVESSVTGVCSASIVWGLEPVPPSGRPPMRSIAAPMVADSRHSCIESAWRLKSCSNELNHRVTSPINCRPKSKRSAYA